MTGRDYTCVNGACQECELGVAGTSLKPAGTERGKSEGPRTLQWDEVEDRFSSLVSIVGQPARDCWSNPPRAMTLRATLSNIGGPLRHRVGASAGHDLSSACRRNIAEHL